MTTRLLLAVTLWLAATGPVMAQQPEPERIVDVTGGVQAAIDAQVMDFKHGGRAAVLRLSDVLIYPFGIYQPVLTCTVLRACIIELEPGEMVISLIAGDDQRWLIQPTATGAGAQTPLVSVKPVAYNVTTNLVISTDRRVYHLTLDSPPKRNKSSGLNPLDQYTRQVRFYYPEEGVRALEDAAAALARRDAQTPNIGVEVGELSYDYQWRADKGFPWEPSVIFDDGARVFIKLPADALTSEQPLLTVGAKGEAQVMNYMLRDDFYVVDGLFEYARLVLSRPARPTLFKRRRQRQIALHIYPDK